MFCQCAFRQNFVFVSDREFDLKTLGEGNWKKSIHINVFKADFENIFNDSVVNITACNLFWCDVRVKGFSGWVERKSLWGVYETEELD